MPPLIPSPSDPEPNPLLSLHTNENAAASLEGALAATPEPHRTVICVCFALMHQQQTCLLEALEKQPVHVHIEGKVLWDPTAVPDNETYFKSGPILRLIREFKGESLT